jgi:hypothetical protein
MKVWIVIKDNGNQYEPYPQIVRVYSDEENAQAYIDAQEKHHQYNEYDIEEWQVE